MNKIILLLLLQFFWTAAFSQSLPFRSVGTPIQRANLLVHWNAPKHPWPKTLWVYHMVPTKFSPTVISNLMALGSFTEKDRTYSNTNGLIFGNGQNLSISFSIGEIEYSRGENNWTTNLAKDVPGTNQLFQLTADFLPKLGISLSDLTKTENGKPNIVFYNDVGSIYLQDNIWITNICAREVSFVRAVDGVEFRAGGNCLIDFGEHGQVTKISLSWRGLEHDKLYPTATPEIIMKWIREGNAVQKRMLNRFGGETTIDWPAAKNVTIKKAIAYYWGEVFLGAREHQPIFPSWVRPFATLWATVDTGHGNVDVEIDCPVIDEAKQ
jgi:hypothetical protein